MNPLRIDFDDEDEMRALRALVAEQTRRALEGVEREVMRGMFPCLIEPEWVVEFGDPTVLRRFAADE